MIEETFVLKHMFERKYFNKYKKMLDNIELDEYNKSIKQTLEHFFKENSEKESLNFNEFKLLYSLRNPTFKSKDNVLKLLEDIERTPANPELLDEACLKLVDRYYAANIIDTLIPALDSTKSGCVDKVYDLLESYEKEAECLGKSAEDSRIVKGSLRELLESQASGKGLRWRLHCLNYCIGPLHGTSLGHVFARVDTGKTSFAASEVAFFAAQLTGSQKIHWYNNEEDGGKVRLRLHSAVTGMSKAELLEDPDKGERLFKENGGDRIIILDSETSVEEIDRDLSLNKDVVLVLIDQGDKVKFNGSGKYDTVIGLKVLYGKLRNLQKKYKVDIITIGQASGEAEGKKWLKLTHMDYSKTGKPGELDWAVGIGVDFSGPEYARYISVCKNKMKDGEHGKFTATINKMVARYTDAPITRSTTNEQPTLASQPEELEVPPWIASSQAELAAAA